MQCILGLFGNMITERKPNEEQLQSKKDQLNVILSHIYPLNSSSLRTFYLKTCGNVPKWSQNALRVLLNWLVKIQHGSHL